MPYSPATPARYLIQTVARRAGLKPALIRAWERRYAAVTPQRSEGGQRLYSDQDIQRLRLLNEATQAGHSIGQIAKLPMEELESILRTSNAPLAASPEPLHSGDAGQLIERCHAAIADFDAGGLEAHLHAAMTELGALGFMEQLVVPLMQRIGDDWQAGRLRPVHEHMASAAVRATAYELRAHYQHTPGAPIIVCATPVNQLHELGALFAAVLAENDGWRSVHLGAGLPAEEIAAAVKFSGAHAAVVSIGYVDDAMSLRKEFKRLKNLLGDGPALLVGGQGAVPYEALWQQLGIRYVAAFTDLRRILMEIRRDLSQSERNNGE